MSRRALTDADFSVDMEKCKREAEMFESDVKGIVDNLYRAHASAIRGFAWKKTRDAELVDDIVAEVFVRCLRVLKKRGPDAFEMRYARSYLTRVAINLINDEFRRRGCQQTAPLDDLPETVDTTPLAPEQLEVWEAFRGVSSAIGRLSPKKREVFLLHHRDGLTVREISRRLNVKPGTVSTRLHHARMELRRGLGV